MDADDFVTLSARREFAPVAGVTPEEALHDFMLALAAALRKGGCTAAGHIKGMAEGAGPSPLFFSLTSLDREPRFKGGPLDPRSSSAMSMNVIVAGIGKEEAGSILERVLDEHLPT